VKDKNSWSKAGEQERTKDEGGYRQFRQSKSNKSRR
jgi:hypothetical protein